MPSTSLRLSLLGVPALLGAALAPAAAHAACTGLDDATASLSGGVLTITGTIAAESFTVQEAGLNLMVSRISGTPSCVEFSASAVDSITADLGAGDDSWSGQWVSLPQTIDAGDGYDTVQTGAGADWILGGNNDDFVWAGAGDNTVEGGGGDDTIVTLGGNDLISGGYGSDDISSGDGNDWIAGDCTLKSGTHWLISDDFDCLAGSDGADDISAGDGSDFVFGGGGGDSISGDQGDDFLVGGGGTTDEIHGGDGNDLIADTSGGGSSWFVGHGGDGNDIIIVTESRAEINGNAGKDLIYVPNGGDVELYGGSGSDIFGFDDWIPVGDAGSGSDKCYVAYAFYSDALDVGLDIDSCELKMPVTGWDIDTLAEQWSSLVGSTQSDKPFLYDAWVGNSNYDLQDIILNRVTTGSLELWLADRSLDVHEVEGTSWNKNTETWR